MEEQSIIPFYKVVVLGPESTGKSTLCAQLADHYKTGWVKEYAREYLLTNGTDYTFTDLLHIAKGQLEQEDSSLNNFQQKRAQDYFRSEMVEPDYSPVPIFIDTDMYVMKVWCEFVFDQCHQWILDQVVKREYDLYMLCNIDLPWIADELREYPDLQTREKLYHHYKDIMINQQVPWIDINGDYDERLQMAIDRIDQFYAH